MNTYAQLYDAEQTKHGVRLLAEQIGRHFSVSDSDFALVGIHQMGVELARLLCQEISAASKKTPEFGQLDITMYRDDIGTRNMLPKIHETVIPFDVNGREIILVDDVLSSGRTIRAALDALTDYGRPGLIKLAVLVDRGEPEFPIRADFTAFKISLPPERKVVVKFEPDENFSAGIFDVQWSKNK